MHKTFTFCLLLLISALIFSPVNSFAETDVEKIISVWQTQYNRLTTYTAEFTQSIYCREKLQGRTAGRIFFKKPNLFRYQVTLPEEQIIIGDGQLIWVYLPGYKQIIKKAYSGGDFLGPFCFIPLEKSAEPINKIKKSFIIKKPFSVMAQGKRIEFLTLRPKSGVSDINRINLWLETNDFLPLKMEIFLPEETLIRLTYKNVKMNTPLSEELFRLKIPDEVEIYEE